MAAATGGRSAQALKMWRRMQTGKLLRERNEQNGTQTWSPPRLMQCVGEKPASAGSLWPTFVKLYASAVADSQRTSCWQPAWQVQRWKDSPPPKKQTQNGQLPSANEQNAKLNSKREAIRSSETNHGFARTQRCLLLPAARWSNLRTSLSTWRRATSASPRICCNISCLQPKPRVCLTLRRCLGVEGHPNDKQRYPR